MSSKYVNKLILGKISNLRFFHFSPILINQRNIKPIRSSIIPIIQSANSLTVHFSKRKQSIRERIIHELKHYYQGFKLFHHETKTTFCLVRQKFNGQQLTRKERLQINRTLNDIYRLVPFSVFIIVPFLEFTLPIFLKLFPNMLPSTFKQIEKEEENFKQRILIQFKARILLQETLEDLLIESQKQINHNQIGEFFHKIRSSVNQPTIEELIQISLMIDNRLILNHLLRSQLIALCQLFNLSNQGPNSYLRWKLEQKFRRLKIDDQLILNEGIENLDFNELKLACHERGINFYHSPREQLNQWLHLHLNENISLIVLLLSHNVYRVNETVRRQIEVFFDIDRLRPRLEDILCESNVNKSQSIPRKIILQTKQISTEQRQNA